MKLTKKGFYIKNLPLVRLVMIITGAQRSDVYAVGRQAAYYSVIPEEYRKQFIRGTPISIKSWRYFIWTFTHMAIDTPYVVVFFLLFLLYMPFSVLAKLFM